MWKLCTYRGKPAASIGTKGAKRRVTVPAGYPGGPEAFVRRLNAEAEIIRQPGPANLDRIMELYYADRKAAKIVGLARVEEVCRSIRPDWARLYPDDLTVIACRERIAKGRRRGLSDGTIRSELAYVQAALNFAAQARIIPSAPKLLKPPPPRPRERWLTNDEARKLVEACPSFHGKLFIVLSIATAARPKHLLELTWDRVDLRSGIINLDNPAVDRTAKGRARVPINDMARTHLLAAQTLAQTDYVIEYDGRRVLNVAGVFAAPKFLD
jgi:integrase